MCDKLEGAVGDPAAHFARKPAKADKPVDA
jgi:hypothetical protein